jgi:hypothetical protein
MVWFCVRLMRNAKGIIRWAFFKNGDVIRSQLVLFLRGMLKSFSYVFSIAHPGTSEAPTVMILPSVNGIQLSLMSSSAQVAHRQMARPLSMCEYSISFSKLGRPTWLPQYRTWVCCHNLHL